MENTYIRCIMENVINQYPDLDMEEIEIILNKSYSELESSTTSEEFDSILRKNFKLPIDSSVKLRYNTNRK